jgi:DNA polymerase beta
MKDFKEIIIEALTTLKKREVINNEPFKVKAYETVLNQIENMGPIYGMEDLVTVKGIGKKIKIKLEEIFSTGQLQSAVIAKTQDLNLGLYDELLKIHGIGPKKAKELIEDQKVISIRDLQEKVKLNPNLITKASKIGLEHYDDFQSRIPREEMEIHDEILQDNLPRQLVAEIVGSYRRGLESSGDIDVLVTSKSYTYEDMDELNVKQISEFHNYIGKLQKIGYITDILSLGKNKCLAVCKVDSKFRRIDLLMTPSSEFAYAKLYFTGSKEFNIAMRNHALKLGWSLSEHELTRVNAIGPAPGYMEDEEDIFAFLKLKYVTPKDRKGIQNFM